MIAAEIRGLADFADGASRGRGLSAEDCAALARALHAVADDAGHLEATVHIVPARSNVVPFPRAFRCVTPGPGGVA